MKAKRSLVSSAFAAAFAAAIAVAALASSCAGFGARRAPDPAAIAAHTAGFVSPSSDIRVVLVDQASPLGVEAEAGGAAASGALSAGLLPEGAFSFSPGLRGASRWSEGGIAIFEPSSPLAAGKRYKARFDRGLALGGEAGKDYFDFDFAVRPPRMEVGIGQMRVAADGSLGFGGVVTLSDAAGDAEVERALRATLDGGPLSISWSHESATSHRFAVGGLRRESAARKVELSWIGRPVGTKDRGSRVLELPAGGDFLVLDVRPSEEGSSRIEIAFSERLRKGQDFRGLVGVGGMEDLGFEADGSVLKVYASARWPARAGVEVRPGLVSEGGAVLAAAASATVAFSSELPAVKFPTSGVILPTSQGATVPIETVNLAGIVVEALRIHGGNMLQFLQVNDLGGSKELKRVGEVVWRKEIDLGWKEQWSDRWIRTGLDLSPLASANPEGMYQIRITFRRQDVRYACRKGHDFSSLEFPDGKILDSSGDDDSSYWDYYDDSGFTWEELHNYYKDPCHPAFYTPFQDHDIIARRNVLVSDIGLVAQRESDGTWRFAATDLRSARPMRGVEVSLYNFQQRELASARSDADGFCELKPSSEPFFAVARSGGQVSYLKVERGQALAASHFDIAGDKADTGIKGLIYGERGVWRPGDEMKLTFVLFDRSGTLPADHPVAFELENPLGQAVAVPPPAKPVGGFYALSARTEPGAPTGLYTARVRVGGRVFSKSLKVETVMPNRLKIELDFGRPSYLTSEERRVSLRSSWLTGKTAPGLKADISAAFRSVPTSFGAFSDYGFDDPTREVSSERQTLFEGTLDERGEASFGLALAPEGEAPGVLKADILARIFEPSGAFSTEQSSIDFRPYDRYVGIKLPKGDQARDMLLTDTDHEVQIALVDADGLPVKRGEVRLELRKLKWRWWWESSGEGPAEFAEGMSSTVYARGTAQVVDGKATWKFQVKYPEWGRFFVRAIDASGIDASGGHASGRAFYIDWPGWAGRGRGEAGGAAVALSLSADKSSYKVGESVRVSFPSNPEGRALVTLERSGRVIRRAWVEGERETARYEFKATADMSPNVYVHVTFLQPHLQTANDLPIRLYGIAPILVEDPETRLRPALDLPAEIAPESEVEFSVREELGRPMTYTVAIVDEGLLGLTKYRAPDPRDEFYKKEASVLAGFDLYQQVAGAFSGQLETLLAVGGGDDALAGGGRKAERFKAVVHYFPPATLAAGETKRLKFRMGAYVGAVRFMVVAGSGKAFGKAEREVPVRSELMVLPSLPRVLSPNEQFNMPVTVLSYMAPGATVRLSVAPDPLFTIEGEKSKVLSFGPEGEQTTVFKVMASHHTGIARFRVSAESGAARAVQDVELEIRTLGTSLSSAETAVVQPLSSWSRLPGYPGLPGTNSLELELSRFLPLNLTERLGFLIGYPHGCAEQTVSRAFPQVYLPDLAPLSEAETASTRANVAAAIDRLHGFQTSRGGFAFWPGEGEEGPWLSAYATHFLVEARRAGFEVPEQMLDSALAYLKKGALDWGVSNDGSKAVAAYALYALASAGRPDPASMNRLREAKPLPQVASYWLASAYALAGMKDTARALLGAAGSEPGAYSGSELTYGSPFRDKAVLLDALNVLGDADQAYALYEEISRELSAARPRSTQETAYALLAAMPYMKLALRSGSAQVRWALGSGRVETLVLDKGVASIPLGPSEVDRGLVRVWNDSTSPVHLRLVAKGTATPGSEPRARSGISLSVAYFDSKGASASPDSLALGSDIVAVVSVSNLGRDEVRDVALTHRVPSCWEIRNLHVGGPEEPGYGKSDSAFDYQDIRDDRVMTYFSLRRGETKRFSVAATKVFEGDFFLPALVAEAMYDPAVQAVEPGRWLASDFKVVRPRR